MPNEQTRDAFAKRSRLTARSDPWTDLALTLPIFVLYHLGVIFLPIRNAADLVTSELNTLARHSLPAYTCVTLTIGTAFVTALWTLGRRQALEPRRFLLVAFEGALYAVAIRAASMYAVGSLRLFVGTEGGVFSNVVMALGAGFYEELAFRVGVFGVGALVLRTAFTGVPGVLLTLVWAGVEACAFSAWHYTGSLGDRWDAGSFVFRAVCGLLLTAIYAVRGFAPAVWAHAIYDMWVMVSTPRCRVSRLLPGL